MSKEKNSILIVDDEALNLTALTHMLKNEYTIYVEKDGQGCLDAAHELHPDLILLDILMPAMNGFEVIAALKKDEVTRDIPVIFVTGLSNAQDEEMGFVMGAADYINKPFSAAVVKLRVRNQIKIVNQMREIKALSTIDPLTKIGNRRFFFERLEQEWSRAKRQQAPLSLMMLDIDDFKSYNDKYGHLPGDDVLIGIAQIIKSGLARAVDISSRWGGEEFAIILPGTEAKGAKQVAEGIIEAVRNREFTVEDGTTAKVTISIGIHCVIPSCKDESYDRNNLLSDADKALYHAKTLGKNRVCSFCEIGVDEEGG